jgi:nucleoside-diphosphate-sugar epimerase
LEEGTVPSAFIIGGTGQIGRAVAQRLSGEGWEVRLASRTAKRDMPDVQHVLLDTTKADALEHAIGGGADLLMDCVAFDAADADRLLGMQKMVGRIVAVSSASVYCDANGRTLDEAADCGFPHFPVPIPETHPTVAPGPTTYSTRKVAMENRLLRGALIPVTILRPCAIHGPYSKHAREWWFVKRLLDGRQRIPLAFAGQSRFQTTSTVAIAEAVLHAAMGRAAAIVNVTDGDAPRVIDVGHAIMAVLGVDAELVPLADGLHASEVGSTPWSVERPMICASSLPATMIYAKSVPACVEWLVGAMQGRDWREVLPQLAAYPRDHFDYVSEDALLGANTSHGGVLRDMDG